MNVLSSGTLLVLLSWCCCVRWCHAWTQAELDLFDLVEEIGQNFYEVLQIEQTASNSEIRRAYRRLSLQYHPDKNSEPDAADKFRKIGAVAEVLRDEELRAMYDQVLIEGLPDWRQPIYYYRRVRKMSVWELSALLLAIATFAQFLYGWAQYFEKWLVLNELREKKARKEQRGAKARKQTSLQLEAEIMFYTQLANDCIPHYSRLLPVVIVKKLLVLAATCFYLLKQQLVSFAQKSEDEFAGDEPPKTTVAPTRSSARGKQGRERQLGNVAADSKKEAGLSNEKREEDDKKMVVVSSQQGTNLMESSDGEREGNQLDCPVSTSKQDDDMNKINNRGTESKPHLDLTGSGDKSASSSLTKVTCLTEKDEEKEELSEKEAGQSLSPVTQHPNKSVEATVTSSASNKARSHRNQAKPAKPAKLKAQNCTASEDDATVVRSQTHDQQIKLKLPSDTTAVGRNSVRSRGTSPAKVTQNKENDGGNSPPTDPQGNQTTNNLLVDGEFWSQFQQQQLEWSLRQYPRSVENRWQLIAMNVPGKSEADCKERYKTLVDMVHQKKSSTSTKLATTAR